MQFINKIKKAIRRVRSINMNRNEYEWLCPKCGYFKSIPSEYDREMTICPVCGAVINGYDPEEY